MTKYKSARDEIIGTFDFETLKYISDIGIDYQPVEEDYPDEEKVAFFKRYEKEIVSSWFIGDIDEKDEKYAKFIEEKTAEFGKERGLLLTATFLFDAFVLDLAFDMTDVDDDDDGEELEERETSYNEIRDKILEDLGED